jgi:hypothetical protein
MNNEEIIREQIRTDFSDIREKQSKIKELQYEIEVIEENAVKKLISRDMLYCLKVNYSRLNKMRF